MLGADPDEVEDEDSKDLTADLGLTVDEDPGEASNSEYLLRVRVSDPSTASAIVNVIVKVTEVNEAPSFDGDAPMLLRVVERARPAGYPGHHGRARRRHPLMTDPAYAVTDQDGSADRP